MLIGFLGGTFDPIHKGHLHVAQAILQHLPVDHVRLVLAARPGHRQQPNTSIEHRWQMLQLACDNKRLVADDIELSRQGPSYTIDTLEQYRAANPDWVPCWILGWDAFITLPQWHRWREIVQLCNLVVVKRPASGQDHNSMDGLAPIEIQQLCHQHETKTLSTTTVGQILRLDIPMLDVSATQIRTRIRDHEPCEDLLVEPVNAYIMEHGLYEA